jgi:hypothetical protein
VLNHLSIYASGMIYLITGNVEYNVGSRETCKYANEILGFMHRRRFFELLINY